MAEKIFQKKYSSSNWFPRAFIGLVLGLLLAIGLTGIILQFAFGNVHIFSPQGQFLMWIVSPIWTLIFSLIFFFRTTLSAFLYLSSANIVVWLLVYSSTILKGWT